MISFFDLLIEKSEQLLMADVKCDFLVQHPIQQHQRDLLKYWTDRPHNFVLNL